MRPEFCGCVCRRTPRFSRGSRRGAWTAVLGDLQQPADDSKKIAYTRKLLNDWNGVPEGTDTSVESSEGCQRASEIINEEQDRIERLATHLLDVISMDEAAIYAWFTLDDTPPVES